MHVSKTGKMASLTLENSGALYCVQIDASSKLTNIVDQRDPNHDCYKGYEIIYVCFMLKPTLEMTLF